MSPGAPSIAFHRLAQAEYVRALRWYGRRSATAAARFQAAMGDAVLRMTTNPLQGPQSGVRFRWVRLRRFPYILHYDPSVPGRITVYAVAHTGRRPGYWIRRVGP